MSQAGAVVQNLFRTIHMVSAGQRKKEPDEITLLVSPKFAHESKRNCFAPDRKIYRFFTSYGNLTANTAQTTEIT